MLALSGCTLSDEDAARQARNPDVVSSTAEGTQATAPSDTDVTASTMMKPVAGLGAPIALLINNAGVPGLGNTSMANVRVTPEQQACLEREASALERADLRTLTTNGGFVDLTVSGTVIVTKAINACLPPKVLAERLGEEYAMRLRVDKRTDPKFAACITEQIRGESGRLVMEVARVAGRGGQKLPQAVKAVVDPKGLFNPETNIKYGMKYLGKAQKLGGGTTCGTILKYNAGHGAKRMNPTSRNYCAKVKRHIANSGKPKVILASGRGA